MTHRTDIPERQGVLLYDISWQVCGEVTAWLSQQSHAIDNFVPFGYSVEIIPLITKYVLQLLWK